jgi:hypothetical protein
MTITSYRLDNTYKYFNSVEHREKRIKDILNEIKDIKDYKTWYNALMDKLERVNKELYSKQFKNSFWNCHN